MDYLMPTFLGEGPTDTRFMAGLVRRLLEDLLSARAVRTFEIADLFELGDTAGLKEPEVVAEVLVQRGAWGFTIVFVHRDADSRDESKSAPWSTRVLTFLEDDQIERVVFVVPVRMTEAWILADGDALRESLGVSWTDDKLGVPGNPADVESIAEPKSVVSALLTRLSGPPVDVHSRTGERIDLAVLRRVPSFLRMEQALLDVLRNQGVAS